MNQPDKFSLFLGIVFTVAGMIAQFVWLVIPIGVAWLLLHWAGVADPVNFWLLLDILLYGLLFAVGAGFTVACVTFAFMRQRE